MLAPEGYHEPSLQKKDTDASARLRQMVTPGSWSEGADGGRGFCKRLSSQVGVTKPSCTEGHKVWLFTGSGLRVSDVSRPVPSTMSHVTLQYIDASSVVDTCGSSARRGLVPRFSPRHGTLFGSKSQSRIAAPVVCSRSLTQHSRRIKSRPCAVGRRHRSASQTR